MCARMYVKRYSSQNYLCINYIIIINYINYIIIILYNLKWKLENFLSQNKGLFK